ncbi:GntR family transcriptional regulator [Algihabitans albus]|uniref:GntR family transcriptional regulator n=1 Tax=Algihabitans albus TaxID=2164067 RepID=UPI000E5DA4E6|nr:GntR family transcriptional regulator [Algihabitans albus]
MADSAKLGALDESAPPVAPLPLYEIVHRVLHQHISERRLPVGLVLLEGPIAEIFEISRAPVNRALRLLHEEGLIQRFEGRGYLVPGRDHGAEPLRVDIREAGLTLPSALSEELIQRTSWERIYDAVEAEVGSALAFGRYRILETRLADRFGVSRTVAREVLGRMQERGLVEKGTRPHWIVGPLTAKAMRELYRMRQLLEPPALIEAAERMSVREIEDLRDRLLEVEHRFPHVDGETIGSLDEDLHVTCVLNIDNQRLKSAIRQCHLPLVTNLTFLKYLGMPDRLPELQEHRLVFELLIAGSVNAAAAALDDHLVRSLERALKRLQVLSVIPTPELPDYLVPAD